MKTVRIPGLVVGEECFGLPAAKAAAKIKAAGFDAAALSTRDDAVVTKTAESFLAAGVSLGAVVARQDAGVLWLRGDEGDAVTAELANVAVAAARAGAGVLVLPEAGKQGDPLSQAGIDRFRRLAAFAEERGVRLAIGQKTAEQHRSLLLSVLPPPHGVACVLPGACPEDGSRLLAAFVSDGAAAEDARRLEEAGFAGAYYAETAAPGADAGAEEDVPAVLAAAYERLRRLFRDLRG